MADEDFLRGRKPAVADEMNTTVSTSDVMDTTLDIVTRLGRTKFMQEADVETLCDEAAAEIKRLRTVVDPEFFMLRGRIDILEREIERLRGAGDALAEVTSYLAFITSRIHGQGSDAESVVVARRQIDAWKEVHRG